MRMARLTGILLSLGLVIGTLPAHANNGDQMVGVNAIQWGLGGAVVAAPQEAGTLFTNPAGLAVLDIEEVRFDLGFGVINPNRSANNVTSDSDYYLIPAGAAAFRLNERMVLGVGMAGLAGTGVDIDDVFPTIPGSQAVVTTKQLFKLGPGLGYQVNDQLFLGAALHFDYQSLALYNANFQLPQTGTFGFGAGFGAVYKMNDKLQFGLNYTTKQNLEELDWNTTSGSYSMTIDAPAHLSAGVAYKPADDWQVELDVKYIWFNDVFDRVTLHTPTGPTILEFGWDDRTVISLGVQKKLGGKNKLLMGYNYGESPIDPEDVDANLGSVAISEHHLAIGLQRQLTGRVLSTATYTRVFENEVKSSSGSGNSIEMDQNVFHLQVSYAR